MSNLTRAQLRARYRITGRIVLDTALHIGGRGATAITDSPVVRDGEGRPFIPGSSFKGAFRAAVERIVPNLPHLRTCSLTDVATGCLTALPPGDEHVKAYQEIAKRVGRKPGKELWQQVHERLGEAPLDDKGHVTDETLLTLLDRHLCDTCKAFGSPYLASAVFFHDAPISEVWRSLPEVPTQIRDGVGIDRDSERAREGIKFDFEVVPPQVEFKFTLILENPGKCDLGLVALGLQEFINGTIPLGGIRSRGLGRCHLEDVEIQRVDLSDVGALKAYLLEGRWADESTEEFIQTHLGALLKEEEEEV
jgi:CRISPR-associated RAMP protein (TIGR02581 family)